ncbi:MAG: UV DNA damage repair endonuclease UvsE [Desulfobacter sp.]|nr:UV DNA damage repair endonuclease UvsE [Desulfobacter sp.]WDP84926.1 MAG: UV DNA damage repair endonuclease UvsE [Desulfobacter sp.]
MIRFGLCCVFKEHPIKFRRTTASYLARFSEEEQKKRLARLCAENAQSLARALDFCQKNNIGSFRINSQILPLKTHPDMGYDIGDLPGSQELIRAFKACGEFSLTHDIRTTFHPDQFIVLSSPRPDVVQRSVSDLEYQAQVAEWVNADVINIHAGGVYGDKPSAISRLMKTIDTLSDPIRKRLTLENDDKSYSPHDLLPVCRDLKIPLVYDVHHHRCLPDGLAVETATQRALDTWNREPLFHLSSPKNGWDGPSPGKHHDFIDPNDLPRHWIPMDITVEIEAKAKEIAVKQLMADLKFIHT